MQDFDYLTFNSHFNFGKYYNAINYTYDTSYDRFYSRQYVFVHSSYQHACENSFGSTVTFFLYDN